MKSLHVRIIDCQQLTVSSQQSTPIFFTNQIGLPYQLLMLQTLL
ncbi:hypothetical protein [Nostoc punctiforme]|nr:hypothetical protein [Nostoc punctiforme]